MSSSSEVKNSTTTDIDNNIQDEAKSSPAPTPTRKRMSRAEKARLESEELLKSLGVDIDSGRQTRSSRRSGRVESPKPEPPPTPKRKAATNATPSRRGKKAKVEENDQTDHGTNHVEEESQADGKQSASAAAQPTDNSKSSEVVDESPAQPSAEAPAASQKAAESEQQMEVDEETPQSIESTQPQSAEVAPPSPPRAERAASPLPPPQAPSTQPEPSQLVEESSADIDDEIIEPEPAIVSAAAADTTTTAIVIDSESQETVAASQSRQDEPIELVSSPSSDVDAKTQQTQEVTSNAIVDLDTSSNEGDDVKEVTDNSSDIVCSQRPPQQQTQDLDTLDLELINSDSSSHSENEVQIADIPPPTQHVPEAPSQPTSTVESDVVELDIDATDLTVDVAAAANPDQRNNIDAEAGIADAAAEDSVVESTNQQKPIEIPENICTITVNTPVEETITTTSEQLLPQSNVTTA